LLELQDYSLSDRKQAFLLAVFCLNIQRVVGQAAASMRRVSYTGA
jgi:hypothetical protein